MPLRPRPGVESWGRLALAPPPTYHHRLLLQGQADLTSPPHAAAGAFAAIPAPGRQVPPTAPGSAPRRSLRRSRGLAPQTRCSVGGRPASCLSFCLIHSRPGPFTSVRSDGVRAVRGRWRTPVNVGQHCWKACWGQPLRSSNLLSSAILIRASPLCTRNACRQVSLRSCQPHRSAA